MMNINPRQMQAMMRKMGINQEEIDAEEVIIRTKDEDIHIKNPSVQKVKAMGQTNYQVSGVEEIFPRAAKVETTDEDIKTVMEQAGVSKEKAASALKKSDGDIAQAILLLSEE